MTDRRSFLAMAAAAASAALPAASAAQAPARRYGAISVVGDQLTVVAYQPSTGTSISRNERWPVPIETTEIDDAALLAVASGLPAAAAPAFYRVPKESFGRWQRMAEGGAVDLPSDVASALERDGVTHLVLVGRLRAPASVRLQDGRVGSGNLEGLGFYLDHGMATETEDRSERGKGFIAPYCYVQVALIDLAARRVVKREPVRAASGVSAARSATGRNPWEALTPEQKSQLMSQMLQQELGAAVGRLTSG
jgi:hypothetical protein